MEVWYTSNLQWLRLGEEKKKERKIDRRKKPQDKNIMSASATQGGHNNPCDKWKVMSGLGSKTDLVKLFTHQNVGTDEP